MMMGRTELCAWLRANSSGDYRPAAEAADEIEHLAEACDGHFRQAMENGAKANELREALAYMVANIGQPVSLETRDGFAKAKTLLER
jgi:alkylhydroperoxidase/carboxymuconolactone decarboxylase family protein YurZ